MHKSLFVFAGDVSADRHTGKLLAELKQVVPGLQVWGCGGTSMRNQGVEILYDLEQFGVMGVVEVLRSIPFFYRLRKEMVQQIKLRKPDAVLLVDFSGFNLQLAKSLRKQDDRLPILYFISPQIWGSRPWRMKTITQNISRMLTIFPFEEQLYREAGVNASFVGHPLARAEDLKVPDREQYCRGMDLDPQRPILGIFPGSRRQEIVDMMPIVLQSIAWLSRIDPNLQYVISRANEQISELISDRFERKLTRLKTNCKVVLEPIGSTEQLMDNADILWVKSGTTTLEATISAKPMLIFYRANWISYLLFLLFKRVQHVGWPNLLAGREIVPELLQLDCRAEQLVRRTLDILSVPGLQTDMTHDLKLAREALGQGRFAKNAAAQVASFLSYSESVKELHPQ